MLKGLSSTMDAMENSSVGGLQQGGGQSRGYLPEKSTIPRAYDGNLEEWKAWRDDFADFFDKECWDGTTACRHCKEKGCSSEQVNPGQVGWSVGNEGDWRSCSGMACIERIDNRVARTVIMSVETEDGFEAWRRLHMQFEPKLVIRQGQVLADFAATVSRPAQQRALRRRGSF